MLQKAHVDFPEPIRISLCVLMAQRITRRCFFNTEFFKIGKKTLHGMADIAQRLAIPQVTEQKGEQMSQYIQILAAFVTFVFFFGCFSSAAFTISRGIFLASWGKRCSLAMEGVCFEQPQYMVYRDKYNLPFLFFSSARMRISLCSSLKNFGTHVHMCTFTPVVHFMLSYLSRI